MNKARRLVLSLRLPLLLLLLLLDVVVPIQFRLPTVDAHGNGAEWWMVLMIRHKTFRSGYDVCISGLSEPHHNYCRTYSVWWFQPVRSTMAGLKTKTSA